ncbi:STAS domain-containing protein [uncultured Shewanella sp.]|uniref:STAS domain-containing protein n=1 Tax=uncultured Shewanella sp. TaxID=173975 RepID=UPI002626BDC0|nr:STAS domain-containing protein [uncultured Shewanella sp.]
MKFTPLKQANACLITLPKEMLMTETPTLRAAILKQISSGVTRLIMDLHQVEFIDSSGLSVLISAMKKANQEGGEVVLLSPSDGVRALIELTRLHQVFHIYESQPAAIDYICGPLSAIKDQ